MVMGHGMLSQMVPYVTELAAEVRSEKDKGDRYVDGLESIPDALPGGCTVICDVIPL